MPLKKFTETSATIVASLIGGCFALAAAVLPNWLSDKPPATNTAAVQDAPQEPSAVSRADAPPTLTPPNFLYGTWTLFSATDDEGTNWNNSTLKFTEQTPTPDGAALVGYFEWRSDSVLEGREEVIGNYLAASRQVYLEGRRVDSVDGRLGVGSFSARLLEDDRALVEGTWGTSAGNLANVPGSWNARR